MSDLESKIINNRKKVSFKMSRGLVKFLYHRPKYKFLEGDGFQDGPFLFIVNHVGSNVPTRIECYFPRDFYMWGTHLMTEGIKKIRYYLIHIYYHQKKKVPLFFAHIIGTLFAPFAAGFYQGMRLIPTYEDMRMANSINVSVKALQDNKAIVIYPEDSSDGYKDEIEKFLNGFLFLCEAAKRKGIDLPIYVSYFKKKGKLFVVDKPIPYSEINEKFKGDKNAIADYLRLRMNELSNIKKKD